MDREQRAQKALELAETRSHEELQIMVDNDARFLERVSRPALSIGVVVSALVTAVILSTSQDFDPSAVSDLALAALGFCIFILPLYLISGILICMLQADANPGVPYGLAEEAQNIQRHRTASRRARQNEQTKS